MDKDERKLREAQDEDEDLLADYFEKSASAVRDSFGRCVLCLLYEILYTSLQEAILRPRPWEGVVC